MKRIKYNWKSLLKELFFWFRVVIAAILLAIAMRVFLFASFKIPTPSMEPAVLPGDFVIVNKQIPGPRIIKNFFSPQKNDRWEVKRFRGIRKIRRNDVLVFNFPYESMDLNLNVNYLKRCVAIPGDTFYIENSMYKVKNCPDVLGNREAQLAFSQRKPEEIPPEIFRCFPLDSLYGWNVKSFGPLYVPKKGDTLRIDSANILLYRNPIRYETGKEIPANLQTYIFQQNYYFMAGDLVSDSRDSRYWGLLPEDHIVGKAILVWKSVEPKTGKIRWKRICKTIK
ncbi:signal peptidase I [Bacteroidia bacterium]|nr:signal peptidase I [Bacteroidia bacterium]